MKAAAAGSVILAAAFALLRLWFGLSVWYSLAVTFGTVGYHLIMRLTVGRVFDACMKNRADYSKAWYRQKSFEAKLYEKLRVRKWKGKMPTYEPDLFDPGKHTWDKIAQAMCQAELVHETAAVLSFLPLFAAIPFGAFPAFLITSILGATADLAFAAMQRYNRPRVVRLAQRQKLKKEQKKEDGNEA